MTLWYNLPKLMKGGFLMADKMICPICGETTSSYMGHYRKDKLCKKHASEFKNGKLIQCAKCGEWHYVDKPCKCGKVIFTELPTEGFNKCVSCGADTNGYAFCRKCFKKYDEEELIDILNNADIVAVEDNVEADEDEEEIVTIPLHQKNVLVDTEQNKTVVIDFNNKSKCITCGKQTDGLLFCTNCYHKYKNKELLFKITNCTNIELLEEDYEGRYTCKDGHVVKSKSERDIDNYLFEHGISHAYERELPYGATEKEVLHPDFYLPNYLGDGKHVYIEHWGYNENNIQYTKTKKFKMPIYKKLGITLICTYEKTDMGKIDTVLDRKLNKKFINENQVNYEDTTPDTTTSSSKSKRNNNDEIPF